MTTSRYSCAGLLQMSSTVVRKPVLLYRIAREPGRRGQHGVAGKCRSYLRERNIIRKFIDHASYVGGQTLRPVQDIGDKLSI